jgi:methyl-accepting chemotaxis protein
VSIQDAFDRASRGDVSRLDEFRKVCKHSDNDRLVPAMIAMLEAIANTINEMNTISIAVSEGKLDIRSNPDQFEGGYKQIIIGMNTI